MENNFDTIVAIVTPMAQSAVGIIRISVWNLLFSYLGLVRNIWIVAEEKQRYLWIINLSGAIANVVLNTFFIPVWGINGAALASLITQFFTNVVMGWILKPIRTSNRLMLQSLHPRTLLTAISSLRK